MGISADNHHHNHHQHHHMNFNIHFPHLHLNNHQGKKGTTNKEIPKGCLAIMVGHGEEQQRFVIPVMYINHPLFMDLLKEAEKEFGYDHVGPITIPCQVEEFRNVQGIIEAQDHHHLQVHHHLCFI